MYTLKIQFKNYQVMSLCWVKMESKIYTKNWFFFFFLQFWNLFSNSFNTVESTAAYLLLFTGLCLANASKCMKLFSITWAYHNLSFILYTVMVWNIKQMSWFSPWRCIFNSFKWVGQIYQKCLICDLFLIFVF